ncbi:MAG: M20/M25/M40 family metallo-hydrolase [Lysobacteraceae bacterium]|nr:MAG: M20/M25/M40 family metallo-hydrolase [Xanthomonadaceae bacterium]
MMAKVSSGALRRAARALRIPCGTLLATFAIAVPAHAASPGQDRNEARAMLATLVAFRTTASGGQTAAMAAWLRERFLQAGFAAGDIELLPVDGEAALIVRYRGAPSARHKPVLFLAHMDVVDAAAGEWSTDPWLLTEKDAALYGRGVVDNKYGLLTLAHAFIRLKREGFVPDRDLVLAFSGDEETTFGTTRALAQRLQGAAFAVNSDAGGGYRGKDGTATYGWQAAEKTYVTFAVTARNPGGHSSAPRPDNAIYELADALGKLARHRFPVRWNEVSLQAHAAMAPMVPGATGEALARFARNPRDTSALAVLEQDPGIDRDLRTTCVATMLQGGLVENALPTSATATVNCRVFPGDTVAALQSTLADVMGNPKLEIRQLKEAFESPVSALPAEAEKALRSVLALRAPNASIAPYMEAGGTDGMVYRRAGIPTIGLGPLFSSEESNYNFHGNNERLPVAEFEHGLDHYYRFIRALASGDGVPAARATTAGD